MTYKSIFNSNLYFDPLQQFDSYQIFWFVTILPIAFIIIFLFWFFFINQKSVFIENYDLVELFLYNLVVNFLYSLFVSNILCKKNKFIILFSLIFLVILGSNLSGLIPYAFTITSAFIITFIFALVIFTLINLVGVLKFGLSEFLKLYLPNGTPTIIILLLVAIEIISYYARLFSLSIRLFANMMAGHTLSKILIGFSFNILCFSLIFSFSSLIPWIIVVLIFLLEILIALLQAYVFGVLISIYTNDVYNLH